MRAKLCSGHNLYSTHSRKVLTIGLILIVANAAWAQDDSHDSYQHMHMGLYLSAGSASYREDLIVPIGFHGPDLSLGVILTRQSEKHVTHVRLRFGLGHLENKYSHEAWVVSLGCRLSWVKKLANHRKYGEFSGGICVPLRMNNLFFESWDDAHLYWLTAYTAGVAFLWTKSISLSNSVGFRLEVPLFGWISRPPTYRYSKQEPLNRWTYHFSEPNQYLHFETLDTYRSLYLQIAIARKVGRSMLDFGYEFAYDYCSQPKELWGTHNSIFVAYRWDIGS